MKINNVYDYETDGMFLGLVEDIKDPNHKCRIKIRVFSIFDGFKTEDLPYASPIGGLSGKSASVPAVGKVINVIFPNGDIYEPYYMYSENYNEFLMTKLKEFDDDTYESFEALIVDNLTEIYSTKDLLRLRQLKNQISITNDSIDIELKDNNRHLNLGTASANQQAVLGNHFFTWFDKFIQELQKPTALTGNISAPIIRPGIDVLLIEYQQIKKTFLSNHVNIVDNDSVEKIED